MEDWAEIHGLHRSEGMPIKAIVRATGVSRCGGRSRPQVRRRGKSGRRGGRW